MAVRRWTGLKFLLALGLIVVAAFEIFSGACLLREKHRIQNSVKFVTEEQLLKSMNIPPLTVGDLLAERLAFAQSQVPSMASQIAIRSIVRYFTERFTPINVLVRQYDEAIRKPQNSQMQSPILVHTVESMKQMWRRVMAETQPDELIRTEQLNLPCLYTVGSIQNWGIAGITIAVFAWVLIHGIHQYKPRQRNEAVSHSTSSSSTQTSSESSHSSST